MSLVNKMIAVAAIATRAKINIARFMFIYFSSE